MNLKRYQPRNEKEWKNNGAEGGTVAKLYTEWGIVEVFTYVGGQQGKPFTALEMWMHPHVYYARYDRHYHDRWLRRLAREFAWECEKWHDKSMNGSQT